jgi:hypothetical protein
MAFNGRRESRQRRGVHSPLLSAVNTYAYGSRNTTAVTSGPLCGRTDDNFTASMSHRRACASTQATSGFSHVHSHPMGGLHAWQKPESLTELSAAPVAIRWGCSHDFAAQFTSPRCSFDASIFTGATSACVGNTFSWGRWHGRRTRTNIPNKQNKNNFAVHTVPQHLGARAAKHHRLCRMSRHDPAREQFAGITGFRAPRHNSTTNLVAVTQGCDFRRVLLERANQQAVAHIVLLKR